MINKRALIKSILLVLAIVIVITIVTIIPQETFLLILPYIIGTILVVCFVTLFYLMFNEIDENTWSKDGKNPEFWSDRFFKKVKNKLPIIRIKR